MNFSKVNTFWFYMIAHARADIEAAACQPVVVGASQFYGVTVGPLSTLSHQVSGDVYIVDETRIRIKNFVYDGQGPGIFFYKRYRST